MRIGRSIFCPSQTQHPHSGDWLLVGWQIVMACSFRGPCVLQLDDGPFSGPLTVLASATLMSAIMLYGWPFATDFAGFAVVAALVGCVATLMLLLVFLLPSIWQSVGCQLAPSSRLWSTLLPAWGLSRTWAYASGWGSQSCRSGYWLVPRYQALSSMLLHRSGT